MSKDEQIRKLKKRNVKTDEGHAYLALVTDAYSRKIMGWSLENNMKVSMVKDALAMAHKNCTFKHETIIHHSDRGINRAAFRTVALVTLNSLNPRDLY